MGTVNSAVTPWFATTQLNAPELRNALSAAFASSPSAGITPEGGVLPGGGTPNGPFVPTSNGSSSAPSVSVAPGQLVLPRPTGGTYVCTWPAAATVALDLSLPAAGQTRFDLLVGEVVDPEADSGATTGTVFRCRTIAGTPSASPSVPAVPAGVVPLWQWRVNNAGAITEITSRRQFTRAPGGVRLVEPSDTRGGSYPGDLRIFATGRIDAWIGGVWLTVVSPAAWVEADAIWTYEGSAGGGTGASGTVNFGTGSSSKCRYKRTGNDLMASWTVIYGTGFNTGSGQLKTYLPAGMVSIARRQFVPCQLYVDDAGSGTRTDWAGMAYVPPSSNQVYPYFPLSNTECRLFTHLVAVTPGTVGQSRPTIIGGYAAGGTISIGPGLVEVIS